MPGGMRWDPTKEPFTYAKLCYYYFPGLLLLLGTAVVLVSAYRDLHWLNQAAKWLPSSTLWRAVIVAVLIGPGYYLLSMKLLWMLLPASVRARIPYDAKEASESKGDIRSFWDLRKLWSGGSRSTS